MILIQDTTLSCFLSVASVVLLLSFYYQVYAKSRQAFSEDERKILIFAHIAKNNDAKRKASAHRLL
ncbi:unnamed protein product, partial [Aphanomyces euteiches]